MNEATIGHEAFCHGDLAPRTLAVGKIGLRRKVGWGWQRRVHAGILIKPDDDCQ
ncbi:MAG: hypothetical protein OXI53_05900 [Nitrospira sp.]|nr:hypothetical protein [Nitrospira sp.]